MHIEVTRLANFLGIKDCVNVYEILYYHADHLELVKYKKSKFNRNDVRVNSRFRPCGNGATTGHTQPYPPITSIALINCLNDNLIPYSNCSAIRPLLCDIKWARTRIELD